MAFFLLLLLCLAPSGLGRRKHASLLFASHLKNKAWTEDHAVVAEQTEALAGANASNNLDPRAIVRSVQNFDPKLTMEGSFEGLATIDFKEEIVPQLETVAVSVFGGLLGAVNPFLGFAFTMIGGMITSDGDKTVELFRKIREMVGDMITQRLHQFYEKLKTSRLSEIYWLIEKYGNDKDLDRWDSIATKIETVCPTMFNAACWISTKPDDKQGACVKYRTKEGRGESLLINIEFMRLVESVYYSLLLVGSDRAEDIQVDIKKALPLLYGHLHDWSPVRLSSTNFKNGSWVEGGPGYMVRQGQDAYVHRVDADRQNKDLDPPGGGEYKGSHCIPSSYTHRSRTFYPAGSKITYQQYGRRRAARKRLQADLDDCKRDWVNKIQKEQDIVKRQVNAALRAGTHIVNKDQKTWLQHSKYISGGSDGSCPAGYRRERRCRGLEKLMLTKKTSNGAFVRVGCRSHYTPGTGCFHNGRHVWTTALNCPEARGSSRYLALCVEDEHSWYGPCGETRGKRPQTADACKKAASDAMSGIKPRAEFVVGSWGDVPRGCSVKTHGDWQVRYNTNSGGRNDGTYSVVCERI